MTSPVRRLGQVACVVAAALAAAPAGAQLASSFYNVTAIRTRRLPNAVQVTIVTDGAVQFGTDVADLLTIENNDVQLKPTTSLRLRLLRARSRVPALIEVGAYPVDSAVLGLGEEDLKFPFFPGDLGAQPRPRLDITLRFYVPVKVVRFTPQAGSSESGSSQGYEFSDRLSQLQVEVAIGRDQRSIVVTVVSDRVDFGRAASIKRSPAAEHSHALSVQPLEGGRVRLNALHTPLPAVLDALADATATRVVCRADAADVDVSMHMPWATASEVLAALGVGYGLSSTRLPEDEGGGWSVGRDGPASATETIRLKHLTPTQARSLLPDFLLTMVRIDDGNAALVASGPPAMLERLGRDVALLDQPRPQVRVEAQVWEVAADSGFDLWLRGRVTRGGQALALDALAGEVATRVAADEARLVTAQIVAMQQTGHARLVSEPFVVVASGEKGTLFMGQQRYVTILGGGSEQTVDIMPVPVGQQLTVIPTLSASGEIGLDLQPRSSSVSAIERGTGMPTLTIYEVSTHIRVGADDTVLVAALRVEGTEGSRRSVLGLPSARRKAGTASMTVVLVKARRVT